MNEGQIRNKFDSNFNSFTVKHCTHCNYAWENDNGKQLMYWDFPKYKLEKKTCKKCSERIKRWQNIK